ncbi:MAG: CYCXC family (seleno)protein [Pyrinomonadaceae bacterium]
MTNKTLLVSLVIIAVAAGVALHRKMDDRSSRVSPILSASNTHSAKHAASPSRVPAFQSASEAKTLKATLSPTQFVGKTRDAYKAAQQIPEILAQLPCYCHCDEGFGHKSLHSCFEDDHAAHCAVCVDEALLAYQLKNQQKLGPEEIRQIIIGKYSA